MSITIIDNESGKAYEFVVSRQPQSGDTYLGNSGVVWTPEKPSTGMMPRPGYRHILKEIPSPYVLRSEVEPLRLAAQEVVDEAVTKLIGQEPPSMAIQNLLTALEARQAPNESVHVAAQALLEALGKPEADEDSRFTWPQQKALAAALEPFQSPPEVQERWRWEGDSIFDGDTEFNIANVEGCTELVAALNELNAGKDGQ